MERRLGRGLGSLLGDTDSDGDVLQLELDQIQPNPFQPRKAIEESALLELRDSVQNHGILQPVIVRRAKAGFELIAGERRWRAAQLAGLARIPAVVRKDISDPEMLELALVENVQRRDLNPIERAEAFRSMMQGLDLTQEGVAAKVGLRRSTVTNHLRLLDLPAEVQRALSEGLLTMGHAKALLGLAQPKAILELLGDIVRRDLSVRDVERLVRERLNRKRSSDQGEAAAKPGPDTPPWAAELERRMRDHLGTRVSVQPSSPEKGKIVIDYFSRESLDRLCEILAPRAHV